MTRRQRGFAQRLLALSSFGFCRPTRVEFTQGRLDVSATSSNNPFVAAGVAIAKPEKRTVVEQGLKTVRGCKARLIVHPHRLFVSPTSHRPRDTPPSPIGSIDA